MRPERQNWGRLVRQERGGIMFVAHKDTVQLFGNLLQPRILSALALAPLAWALCLERGIPFGGYWTGAEGEKGIHSRCCVTTVFSL